MPTARRPIIDPSDNTDNGRSPPQKPALFQTQDLGQRVKQFVGGVKDIAVGYFGIPAAPKPVAGGSSSIPAQPYQIRPRVRLRL
ncbi:MAG: hypothetical protein M1815_001429 [Lichina confinis]|nr:MAG: hypothetical protein M1815_001429 [Lichina confinis]